MNREVVRDLPVPLMPIRGLIRKMCWAPDEVVGSTERRMRELKVVNPGEEKEVVSLAEARARREGDVVFQDTEEDGVECMAVSLNELGR